MANVQDIRFPIRKKLLQSDMSLNCLVSFWVKGCSWSSLKIKKRSDDSKRRWKTSRNRPRS